MKGRISSKRDKHSTNASALDRTWCPLQQAYGCHWLSREQKLCNDMTKHWFLLQTSLSNISLVEMSWKCLELHARCYFLFEQPVAFSEELCVTSELFLVNCFNDGGEHYPDSKKRVRKKFIRKDLMPFQAIRFSNEDSDDD